MKNLTDSIKLVENIDVTFDKFKSIPFLTDDVIYLVCINKVPFDAEKNFDPYYEFHICKEGEQIGGMRLRVGNSATLLYPGHIGYEIREEYRGQGYAVRACKLLFEVAKMHQMSGVLITNDIDNSASRRVCEKLEMDLWGAFRVPKELEMYDPEHDTVNVYFKELEKGEV